MSEQVSRYESNSLRHHVTSNLIAASAGTGKTYQLASRYIALLVLGARPEEIIALTFTRKAAGEFRNRILHALAEGACDKRDKKTGRNELAVRVWDVLSGLSIDENGKAVEAANPVPLLPVTAALVKLAEAEHSYPEDLYNYNQELQDYYGFPKTDARTFARLLKEMVAVLGKLRLTTIDSFFSSLVATNSLELGMNSAAPLDPADENRVQASTIRDYLDAQGAEEHSREEFLRIFSSLTGGVGNKTQSQISAELKSFLKLYRELPTGTKWGDAAAFGAETQLNVASDAEMEEYKAAAATLRSLLRNYKYLPATKGLRKQLNDLAAGVLVIGKTAAKWLEGLRTDFPGLPELAALLDAFDAQSPMSPELEQNAAIVASAPDLYSWNKTQRDGLEEVIRKLRDAKKWNHTAKTKAFRSAVDDLLAQQANSRDLQAFKHCSMTLGTLAAPCKLRQIADRTAALHSLLAGYADCYEQRMLAEGRLSFADIARMAKTLMLKDIGDPTLLRHHVAYRMGGELHHWMLDEFQDTSEDQFTTLTPLLQPIANDARANAFDFTTERWESDMPRTLRGRLKPEKHCVTNESIFVVGDVKQSIYGFRTGKTEVFDRLKTDDTWKVPLQASELKRSFRSSPVIMGQDGFINRLFSTLHSIECPENGNTSCIETAPVTHLKQFAVHRAAKDKVGYVEIMAVAPPQEDDADTDSDATSRTRIYDAIVHKLHQLTDADRRPLHGMSIAILVRSNAEADEIMAWLGDKMPGLPHLLVKDTLAAAASPLGEILLYFFKWLLHPSDAAALNIARTSFLGKIFDAPADQVHAKWLRILQETGYASTLDQLIRLLDAPDRAANEHTIRLWQDSALAFDAEGSALADWCNRMKNLSVQAAGSSGAVQIMTMHKSKGLEFDAVILPYAGTQAVDDTRDINYFITEDGNAMLLKPGAKSDWAQLSPVFPELASQWQQNQRREAYNLLYVAATRARHANYIICHGAELCSDSQDEETGETATTWKAAARSMGGFIRQVATRLGSVEKSPLGKIEENQVIYTQGEPTWFEEMKNEAPAPALPATPHAPLGAAVQRRKRVSPSTLAKAEDKQPEEPETSGNLSRVDYGELAAAEFGTLVHAAWEEIIWKDTTPPPDWMADDAPRSKPQSVVYNALKQPEIAALFTRQPNQEVYNEQPIEAITEDDEWLSGTIDRLVLTVDAQGNAIAAHIIDFKTNQLDPTKEESYDALKEEYTAQMTAYREHVAAALGLPESAITVSLLSCPLGVKARIVPC